MKPECWSAVRGASGREFAEISSKPAPCRRSQLRRGRTCTCTYICHPQVGVVCFTLSSLDSYPYYLRIGT